MSSLGGGGSGGSIYMTTAELDGSGTIEASIICLLLHYTE